jgi:hypothetical protein
VKSFFILFGPKEINKKDKLVGFSNGQLALPVYCGLKTGQVFEYFKYMMTDFTI